MATIKNEIVPARLAIKSMMDSGYKNAAYALAELMDNSIQAAANTVELLCIEKISKVDRRSRAKIDEIAVLDNGHGMSMETLQLALQFGNGTRLDTDKHTGMGKFGMGLPSASISQARRVEVWSWQSDSQNALFSYLDVDEIISGEMSEIPPPVKKEIPEQWMKTGKSFGKSGTLVVWSGLDRCIWKTGKAIIANSEFLIGRMYRKFLNNSQVKIRMATFDGDSKEKKLIDESFAKPNDPLYLMSGTSTPAPYDIEPMFEPWPSPENHVVQVPIKFHGKTYPVYVRMSMAKLSARSDEGGGRAGNRLHGQHAAKNIGVSVLRAGRELELDPSWANWGERRERWWGLEVEFPPALDELFGVTNNKQYASHFAEMAKTDVDDLIKSRGKSTIHDLKEEMAEDEDPSLQLLELTAVIRKNIADMQGIVYTQNRNDRSEKKRREFGFGAELEATEKTRKRQEEGHAGESDAGEGKPAEDRKAEIRNALEASGLAPKQAEDYAHNAIDNSLKYLFVEADTDSQAFFSVQPKGGAIMLILNTKHAAYDRLVDVLEKESPANANEDSLQERLNNALDGLKLLLMAWARYEDEQVSPQARERAKDARQDWGRMAKRFLERDEG
jgi:hypothetical protein